MIEQLHGGRREIRVGQRRRRFLGQHPRGAGMQRVSLGDHRIAGRNRRGKISARNSAENANGKLFGPKMTTGPMRRERRSGYSVSCRWWEAPTTRRAPAAAACRSWPVVRGSSTSARRGDDRQSRFPDGPLATVRPSARPADPQSCSGTARSVPGKCGAALQPLRLRPSAPRRSRFHELIGICVRQLFAGCRILRVGRCRGVGMPPLACDEHWMSHK